MESPPGLPTHDAGVDHRGSLRAGAHMRPNKKLATGVAAGKASVTPAAK
jgi:hypothetical protein